MGFQMNNERKYSDELTIVFSEAKRLTIDFSTNEINEYYVFYSILENENCYAYVLLSSILSDDQINNLKEFLLNYINGTKNIIGLHPKYRKNIEDVEMSEDLLNVMSIANKEADDEQNAVLDSTHVLLGTVSANNIISDRLNELGVTYKSLKTLMSSDNALAHNIANTFFNGIGEAFFNVKYLPTSRINTDIGIIPTVKASGNEMCANITYESKYSKIIGRKKEINRIAQIIERKDNHNVILVGENGVGKKHISKSIGSIIKSKKIFLLNLKPSECGFLSRILLGKINDNPNNGIIFIINNLYELMSFNNGLAAGEVINAIDGATNDNVSFIFTATPKEYKQIVDLSHLATIKFQKIIIEPNTIEETVPIINEKLEDYEYHHNVVYDRSCVEKIIKLSDQYISNKFLPLSAIDVLDEVGSYAHINKIREVKLSHVLNVISSITNIPISKIDSGERDRLNNIDNILKKKVIGQDEAISSISKAIKRSRVGLKDKEKPLGVYMFLGTTGCGKTLLAKEIAKNIFGDEKFLVRIDMSEYSEKHSVSKLIGSPPGYIGYDQGGQLTEIIKNKKYCVLLLDEIEKADQEIFNIFLQMFDEGRLTSATGETIDFKNVIIIMTSNVGTQKAESFKYGIGLSETVIDQQKDVIMKELSKKFRPEFINRIEEIIYFNSLSDSNLKDIIKLELGKLNKKLVDIGYSFSFSPKVVEYIFNDIKDEKKYGARPILRSIRNNIENKITDLILSNKFSDGYKFKIGCNKDNGIEIK